MPYYRAVGAVPRKRHTRHADADGRLLYEELLGEEGFSAASSLLYHRHVPAAMVAAVAYELGDASLTPNHPLRPRHLLPRLLSRPDASLHEDDGERKGTDLVHDRHVLLGNDDVRISYAEADAPSPLHRNAVGDELVYVASGSGRVETALGVLDVSEGDYVVLPCGLVHRWIPHTGAPLRCLVVESSSHIGPPRRYLSADGQFLEHSPYCERDLRGPRDPLIAEDTERETEVIVRHRTLGSAIGATLVTYSHHPFDVVGWDGCNYPVAFAITDFEPITGRIHQPPPVHQVFEGHGFVVCNFVPRKVDYHPDAIAVPYYHSNVDSDEVLFYCGGSYEARRGSGVGQGSITLHPHGHVHGPNPQAYRQRPTPERVDESAVMIDTFRPLGLGTAAVLCDDPDYPWSWARQAAEMDRGAAD